MSVNWLLIVKKEVQVELPRMGHLISVILRQEKEHKLKLLGLDIFRWGGGVPREGVGAKTFGIPQNLGNRACWRDIPDFGWDIPGVPENFEKESLRSIFGP